MSLEYEPASEPLHISPMGHSRNPRVARALKFGPNSEPHADQHDGHQQDTLRRHPPRNHRPVFACRLVPRRPPGCFTPSIARERGAAIGSISRHCQGFCNRKIDGRMFLYQKMVGRMLFHTIIAQFSPADQTLVALQVNFRALCGANLVTVRSPNETLVLHRMVPGADPARIRHRS